MIDYNKDFSKIPVTDDECNKVLDSPIRRTTKERDGSYKTEYLTPIVYRVAESFRPCSYDNRYLIGNYGTVYDRLKEERIFPSKRDQDLANTYLTVYIHGIHANKEIQHLIGKEFYPEYNKPGMVMDHLNGRKTINTPYNLKPKTSEENSSASSYHNHYGGVSRLIIPRRAKTDYDDLPEEVIHRICHLIIDGYGDKTISKMVKDEYSLKKLAPTFIRVIRYCDEKSENKWWYVISKYKDRFVIRDRRFSIEDIHRICKCLTVPRTTSRDISEKLGLPYDQNLIDTVANLRVGRIYPKIVEQYGGIERLNQIPLTYEEAEKIYLLCLKGYKSSKIAEILGYELTPSFMGKVSAIKTGDTYKEIKEKYKDEEMPRYKKFSDEEIDQMCQCLSKGMKSPEVADALGLEYTYELKTTLTHLRQRKIYKYILEKYPEIGTIHHPTFTDADIECICQLLSEKNDTAYVAQKMGIPNDKRLYHVVYSLRTRREYKEIADKYPKVQPPPSVKISYEDAERIYLYMQKGISYRDIADAMGVQMSNKFRVKCRSIWVGKHFPSIRKKYDPDFKW